MVLLWQATARLEQLLAEQREAFEREIAGVRREYEERLRDEREMVALEKEKLEKRVREEAQRAEDARVQAEEAARRRAEAEAKAHARAEAEAAKLKAEIERKAREKAEKDDKVLLKEGSKGYQVLLKQYAEVRLAPSASPDSRA